MAFDKLPWRRGAGNKDNKIWELVRLLWHCFVLKCTHRSTIERGYWTMENTRYGYSAITTREPLELPNSARLALWFRGKTSSTLILEAQVLPRLHNLTHLPRTYLIMQLRDYGNRVGIWRLMELLDRHGLKASVLLNSDVCEQYPIIIEECKKRDWEFLGHGTSNSIMLGGKSEPEEREIHLDHVECNRKGSWSTATGLARPGTSKRRSIRRTFWQKRA